MTARALTILWAAWVLAGCASILPQPETQAERIAATYATIANIATIAAADLNAATAAFTASGNDGLARSAAENELERAGRIRDALKAAERVIVLADIAYQSGAVQESLGYLAVADDLLGRLEAMVSEPKEAQP